MKRLFGLAVISLILISCEKELKSIGINKPNRFNAYEEEIGLVGCAKSHIKCLEIAKEKKWPFVCIFEDDVVFINSYKVIDKINKYINYDYDVLYIGAWLRNNKYKIIYEDLLKVDYTCCLHAYIVKNHYYDILLNNLNEGLQLKLSDPDNFEYFSSISILSFGFDSINSGHSTILI